MWYGDSYLSNRNVYHVKSMKQSPEIRLKEDQNPTIWRRFVQWLDGEDSEPRRLVLQVPKTGTDTDILLSRTQKLRLTDAVESPGERTSDSSFIRRSDIGGDQGLII